MNSGRPEIKEGIKRQVRQRCGFGCVICGIPVYHYDHMDEYNVVQEHAEDNLTLLCGYHHDLKSRGQLPVQVVRAKNTNPHNVTQNKTAMHSLFYYGEHAEIVAGGNRVIVSNRSVSAVKIDGDSIVDFELVDGNLMLNLDFRDRDKAPVLTVRQNELVHSTHLWDYEFTGKRLSIREKKGQIYLTVVFEADKQRVVIEKGLVSHNGVDLLIDPRGLCILNNLISLSGNSIAGIDTAISIGDGSGSSGPVAMHFEIDRRTYDRGAAIASARKRMAQAAKVPPGYSRGCPQFPVSLSAGRPATWTSICFLPYPWERSSWGA
ncbi:HNH endonuclease signature motif containing protein [Paenarthrobacter sp. PH39-S1]|uniref:HNH endonuclease n=1 Tax=Paenarthrobacter sp. PH39-S1 TaxID=3046204 RepID=UPI0024BA4E2E|nr:HNH endonuclease signature motif containing protein [Paenarthrobacter sp. PH39-S1]MDJ0358589.1 HNH endonuclease signature motif containing protein [Paenarthrobacter sp. PH39-S1]